MIEITCNDRLGKKVRAGRGINEDHHVHIFAFPGLDIILQVRIKCNEDDTIGDLKKLISAQTGTR